MWDLKLLLVNSLFLLNTELNFLLSFVFNLIENINIDNFNFFSKIMFFNINNYSYFLVVKFILAIMFLILIRGGTPRYRYDYLTKLGWLKFLGFIVTVFLSSIFFYLLY